VVNPPRVSAFERPLEIHPQNQFGDDVAGMLAGLPALVEKCKSLCETRAGKKFAEDRLKDFVVNSNKLEGTRIPDVTDDQTCHVLDHFLKLPGAVDDLQNQGSGGHPWIEEGHKSPRMAWYEHCRADIRALKMMTDLAKKGAPLTAEVLVRCHMILMDGYVHLSSGHRGRPIRSEDIASSPDLTTKLEELEGRFGTTHPVAWAIDLLLIVLSVYPLPTGNDLLPRITFAYGLMRHGIPRTVVLDDFHPQAGTRFVDAVFLGQREELHAMAIVGLHKVLRNMDKKCPSTPVEV